MDKEFIEKELCDLQNYIWHYNNEQKFKNIEIQTIFRLLILIANILFYNKN